MNCPFSMDVKLTRNGQNLVITQLTNDHNHEILTMSDSFRNVKSHRRKYCPYKTLSHVDIENFHLDVNEIITLNVNETLPLEVSETLPLRVNEILPLGVCQTIPQDVNETFPRDVNEFIPLDVNDTTPGVNETMDVNETLPLDDSETLSLEVNGILPLDINEAIDVSETLPMNVNITLPLEDSETLPLDNSKTHPFDESETLPLEDIETFPLNSSKIHPFDDSETLPLGDSETFPKSHPFDDSETLSLENCETFPLDISKTHPFDDNEFLFEILATNSVSSPTHRSPTNQEKYETALSLSQDICNIMCNLEDKDFNNALSQLRQFKSKLLLNKSINSHVSPIDQKSQSVELQPTVEKNINLKDNRTDGMVKELKWKEESNTQVFIVTPVQLRDINLLTVVHS